MPEVKHYINEKLNTSYVYTNIKSIEIKKEIYNPNILKSLVSRRSELYQNIALRSYYKNRVDFGDITSEFNIFFEASFCRHFNIDSVDTQLADYSNNILVMKGKGVDISLEKLDNIMSDIIIESKNIDRGFKMNDADEIITKMSPEELDFQYERFIIKNIGGFAPKRSIPKIKTAILSCFRKYVNIKPANNGIVKIQSIVVNNEETFATIINDALNKFKDFHKVKVEKRNMGRFSSDWEIPVSKNYNPEVNKKIDSNLSIMIPLYLPSNKNGKVDELELSFIYYLENHKNVIEWFFKNGDEHMEVNFGIKKDAGYTFQPDFIIKFYDGRIGIFDTKAIGFNENDNFSKSNALYKFISEERYNGKNLIGGLVIKNKSNEFMFYCEPQYKPYMENSHDWKLFDTLL